MKVIQPRELNPRKMATVLVVLAFAFYFYYQREPAFQYWKMSGATMGTTYTIKLLDRQLDRVKAAELKQQIDERLVDINQQMSTWITNSEITVFNAKDDTSFSTVSPGFTHVVTAALSICNDTDGAFDPTLDPLINAWGFGHTGPQNQPSDDELNEARALHGCDTVVVAENGMIRKTAPGVKLNLNAIAKGYGVDEVSGLIERHGITNYMVEIGGEVFARGMSEKARPWRIGIDRPVDDALPGEAFDLVVQIDGTGLASSGDYRNFSVTDDGVRITHILDPRSGRPVTSTLGSVSVIAPDCMTADAAATALYVMGANAGLEWVNERPGIEAVFIEHGPNGLETTYSTGFRDYLFEAE